MKKNDILLHTDQTGCFDEAGIETECLGSGQDGDAHPGLKMSGDRFWVIDTVVNDTWTGLVWHRNANLAKFPLSWDEAIQFVNEMNRQQHSGRSDWRLPTREELFSLISHQNINPCLPENHPFQNIFDGYYWTRTECARLTNQAWYIHMGGARIYRGMKHCSYMVWPVSESVPERNIIKDRFVKQTHSFHDRLTERTWLNDKRLDKRAMTWQEALDRIKKLNEAKVAGYRDWRLPNIRELESLVDLSLNSPAFAAGHLFNRVHEGYWSATTSLYEPRYAWVLYSKDGAIGVGYKPKKDFYLLAIRSS